jgi:NADH-quinone oxidoreductase subunit E
MNIDATSIDEKIGSVRDILGDREKRRGILIPTLHKIQEENGYLPEHVLLELSEKIGIPLAEVYSVASFYKQFHFSPRGRKIVRVCTGTACHVRGAPKVIGGIQEKFKIKAGETTKDLKMTLETVGCVGCCGLAPVVTVNDNVVGDINARKLKALIHDIEEGREPEGDD